MVSAAWPYLMAVGVGLALFCNLYSWNFLTGHGGYFSTGDACQHVSGWRLYADDAWRFPLLKTDRLMYPDGASIAFTDSIPLMAVPFKLLSPILPSDFQYFGYWHLMVYLAQALASAFLVRMMGAPRWSLPFAAFFAVTFPALAWRQGHSSLMMHAFILSSFAIYFGMRRHLISPRCACVLLLVCLVASFLVHPYLFAMVFAIGVATLIDNRHRFGRWRGVLLILISQFIVVATVAVLFGYFNKSTETSGFGVYSMNLWAPFVGGKFTPAFVDATGGQGEGFNYLGLGGGLLIVSACLLHGRRLIGACRNHPALTIMMVFLAAYACSNHVYAGNRLVCEWPGFLNVTKITGTFRCSGRFFWPVGYLVLIGSLVFLTKNASKWAMIPLTLFAAVQWADLGSLRGSVRAHFQTPEPAPDSGLLKALDGARIIACSPSGVSGNPRGEAFVLTMQRMAAKLHAAFAGGYVARGDSAAEAAIPAMADTVVFPVDPECGMSREAAELLDAVPGVRRVGKYYILRRDWSDVDWTTRVPSALLYHPYERFLPVPLDKVLTFDSGTYEFTSGWSGPEAEFRWSLGRASLIRFRHSGTANRDLSLHYTTLGAQTVRIFVNGVKLTDGVRDGASVRESFHGVPMLDGMNEIRFEFPDARLPGNGDGRVLAFALRDLAFGTTKTSPASRP